MIELPYLAEHTPFPPINKALKDPDGLLAFGGSLSVERLFNAYSNGVFPWFSDGEPILWWSPDPRAVILLEEFQASRSLRKLARKQVYTVTLNHNFEGVIHHCASIARTMPGAKDASTETWITQSMIQAYQRLHQAGLAHSVEVWDAQNTLVGGLYGVGIGQVFCGESMFHIAPNTSKLAMYTLVNHMRRHNLAFIDCQMPTAHLNSLGAQTISREQFITQLREYRSMLDPEGAISADYTMCWQKQVIAL